MMARAASSDWPMSSRFAPDCGRKTAAVGSLIAMASPSHRVAGPVSPGEASRCWSFALSVSSAAALSAFAAQVDGRLNGTIAERAPRFLFVHGLHRLRELRKAEEDFGYGRRGEKTVSPGDQFATILREGPAVGIHVIAWCDSVMNLTRAVDRPGMREFTLRVLFQMSANDSAQLIDTPAASRLGRTRALFVEEGTERPEKFRPYGQPSPTWLKEVGAKLWLQLPTISTEAAKGEVPMQPDDSPLSPATDRP